MILARILLLLTVVFWGWSFVATKICLDYMTPVELMGLRFLLALPLLLVIIGVKRVRLNFSGQGRAVALGSAILAAHFYIQMTGIKYTTATNTGWIIAVTPLVMAVLAFLILKERVGRKTVIGIIIATLGILLLISRGEVTELGWLSSAGDWLVLASAHTWALYTIATRNLTRSRNPLAVTFVILLPAAVLVLGVMLVTSDWSTFLHLPAEVVVALLFLGVAAMALAHWFWQEGVSRVGAARAGIFLYLEPLATTGLAVAYLDESFGVFTAIGGLMVLFAVWFAQRKRT
ncbi:MAG: DMT family transporter [Candidatus Zixiibacteriota bacterium]|nr:MAG: DMT family transporter [candidate division Zixibacteria bacterium]